MNYTPDCACECVSQSMYLLVEFSIRSVDQIFALYILIKYKFHTQRFVINVSESHRHLAPFSLYWLYSEIDPTSRIHFRHLTTTSKCVAFSTLYVQKYIGWNFSHVIRTHIFLMEWILYCICNRLFARVQWNALNDEKFMHFSLTE